jgi:uncharacterized membrane protein YczE
MPGASAPHDPPPPTDPASPGPASPGPASPGPASPGPASAAPPRASTPRDTRLRPPLPRRLVQLYVGLALLGSSYGLLVLAGLGLDPWSVLHQGLSRRTGITIGTWAIIVGASTLVLWVPLRQRPGFGTLNNVVIIGLVIDATLALVPEPHGLPARWTYFGLGVLLNGTATGAYIGAGLGPGPRDGLMTGLAARGWSIRVVRTSIELTVLAAGWLLGGTVGLGTLLYAVSVGPIVHVSIPALAIRSGARRDRDVMPS